MLLPLQRAAAARLTASAAAVGDRRDIALNSATTVASYDPKATISRRSTFQPAFAVWRSANGTNNSPTAESAAGKIMKVGHALSLRGSAIWLTDRTSRTYCAI